MENNNDWASFNHGHVPMTFFIFFYFFFVFPSFSVSQFFFSTLSPRNGFPGSMAIWNREIQALLPFQGGYTENGMVEVYLRILPKPSTLIH